MTHNDTLPRKVDARLRDRDAMKRYYAPFDVWEDRLHGMYATLHPPQSAYIEASRRILTNEAVLLDAMVSVVVDWPVSAAVNLTNKSRNRRAWLGQAACCLVCGANEDETKLAWHKMTAAQQDTANQQADRALAIWVELYDAEKTDWNERPGCRSPEDIRDV